MIGGWKCSLEVEFIHRPSVQSPAKQTKINTIKLAMVGHALVLASWKTGIKYLVQVFKVSMGNTKRLWREDGGQKGQRIKREKLRKRRGERKEGKVMCHF